MKKINKKLLKKMVASNNRQVSRDNKKFEALSPAEKRVHIARDVLAQIANKKLVPVAGTWLTGINDSDLFDEKDADKDPELRTILNKTKQCEGCALGGMFMSAVKCADKLKLSELDGVKNFKEYREEDPQMCYEDKVLSATDTFKYLGRFFSQDTLKAIEAAFEQGDGAVFNHPASDFACKVDDSEERMKLIMQNIIVNNGSFKPTQTPIQVWVMPGFVG